jgi:acetyl-CoA acetyltransferase
MTDIVIVSAARTAVGKFGGTIAKTSAVELGAIAIREAIAGPSTTQARSARSSWARC